LPQTTLDLSALDREKSLFLSNLALIQRHINHVGFLPQQFQRGAAELAKQHLTEFANGLTKMIEEGMYIAMDESANLTEMLLKTHKEYLSVERTPLDPLKDWSPGYRRLWDSMGGNNVNYVLLINPDHVRKQHKKEDIRKIEATKIYRMLEFTQARSVGCSFCDLSDLIGEFGAELPFKDFFELFDDDIAILMDPLDNQNARGINLNQPGFVGKELKASVLILNPNHYVIRIARSIRRLCQPITHDLIRSLL
jgi:hypothetical protein